MFRIKENKSTVKTEILAGISTFASMAYVTFINPSIFEAAGMDFGAVLVASIIVTFLASMLMGLLANYPFCLAPGIGVSAFLTFTVVQKIGLTWQLALGATLISSLVIFLLALFHVRRKILMSIPHTLLRGIATGIGLFLIAVAFKNIGLITTEQSIIRFGTIADISVLFTAVSIVVVLILFRLGVDSGFLWVILLNWGLAVILGLTEWKGVFALPPSIMPTLGKFAFPKTFDIHYIVVIFSIFLISLFDSTSGLMILAKAGGYLKGNKLPRMQRALVPDSIISSLCPILGNSNLAFHIESLAGMHMGGKTGLVSVVCAVLFLFCLFLYPLISSIPLFATAPVLIILGAKMCTEAKEINWSSLSDILPFLVIAITMPLTFSIYHGFSFGFISYVFFKLIFGKRKEIHLSTAIFSALFALQLIYSLIFH